MISEKLGGEGLLIPQLPFSVPQPLITKLPDRGDASIKE